MRLTVSVVLALLGAGLGSTSSAQESTADAQELPGFVKELIARQEASPGRSFVRIWRYQYKGETVYFVPQSQLMNDSTSALYSSAGELICKPDGGYFGNGDGRCSDFLQARSMGRLVWRDTRQAETIPTASAVTTTSACSRCNGLQPLGVAQLDETTAGLVVFDTETQGAAVVGL